MKKWPKSKIQRFLIPLFTFVWWNRLWFEHNYHPGHWHQGYVYEVKGWRTAIIDQLGQRRTVTFLFNSNKQLNFTRNSNATYINPDTGLIKVVGENVPRQVM